MLESRKRAILPFLSPSEITMFCTSRPLELHSDIKLHTDPHTDRKYTLKSTLRHAAPYARQWALQAWNIDTHHMLCTRTHYHSESCTVFLQADCAVQHETEMRMHIKLLHRFLPTGHFIYIVIKEIYRQKRLSIFSHPQEMHSGTESHLLLIEQLQQYVCEYCRNVKDLTVDQIYCLWGKYFYSTALQSVNG